VKKAFLLTVSGRVQGVGFRWFTREQAEKLNITGYVKNLWSGSVEIFAEGEEERLERFILELKQGPSFAKVEAIRSEEFPYTSRYKQFSIAF